MRIANIIETMLIGLAGVSFVEALSWVDIESIYKMFVQSLVATAAIGKIVYEILLLRNSQPQRRASKKVMNKKKP